MIDFTRTTILWDEVEESPSQLNRSMTIESKAPDAHIRLLMIGTEFNNFGKLNFQLLLLKTFQIFVFQSLQEKTV